MLAGILIWLLNRRGWREAAFTEVFPSDILFNLRPHHNKVLFNNYFAYMCYINDLFTLTKLQKVQCNQYIYTHIHNLHVNNVFNNFFSRKINMGSSSTGRFKWLNTGQEIHVLLIASWSMPACQISALNCLIQTLHTILSKRLIVNWSLPNFPSLRIEKHQLPNSSFCFEYPLVK